MEREILSPRPIFVENENPKGKISLVLGTKHSGVLLLVSKEGLEFNAYYTSNDGAVKYGVLREFIGISWEELEKLKESLFRKRKRKVAVKDRTPDIIDEELDEAYLEKLPVVTLNGMKFFIDADRKERRPVSNPAHIFKFSSVFTEEK